MPDNTLQAPLTGEETARLQTLLLELLAEQVERYTKGESTSVPAAVARELMASLVLTLGLPGSGKALLHADPHAALAAGQRRLQTRWAFAMQLHALAVKTAPVYQNLALRESLQSIADTRRAYDVRLFAHQLPCSLDYPLLAPPPEDPPGPDYLAAWLRQVIAENRILARLEPFRVQILLARCCPDYQGQLVNLCEPAAVNLLGRAVLDLPPLALTLTDAHRAALRHTKAAPLHEAAERLAKEFDMDAPTLHAVARTLAARIPQGHLENVFL